MRGRMWFSVVCLLVAVLTLWLLPGISSASAQDPNPAQVAALIRNDLAFYGGDLGARDGLLQEMQAEDKELAMAFITIINSHQKAFAVSSDGVLSFDIALLKAVQPSDLWTADDVSDSAELAGFLNNAKVKKLHSKTISAQTTWYEQVYLGTTSYNDSHTTSKSTTRYRYPATMTVSDQTTYTWSASGGADLAYQLLLAWVKVEYERTWTVATGATYALQPGEEGYWNYTDYHFHSQATYDQYFCTDEDIKGQVVKYYDGRRTAYGYKFDHRTWWPTVYRY